MKRRSLARNSDRGSHLATSATADHRFRQPGFALEGSPVMHMCGFDDLASTAEDLVSELEHTQVGPGSRPQTSNLP